MPSAAAISFNVPPLHAWTLRASVANPNPMWINRQQPIAGF